MATHDYIRVFAGCADGGSAALMVIDAEGMSDHDMRLLAAECDYDTGFILPAPLGSECAVALRAWSGRRERAVCPQAIIAAVWLLDDLGRLPADAMTISTKAGPIRAVVTERSVIGADVEILLPLARVTELAEADRVAVLSALGMDRTTPVVAPLQIVRGLDTTVLIPMMDETALDGLNPDFERLDAVCAAMGSDGLFAYTCVDTTERHVVGRHFPNAPSCFREDVASGWAAVASMFGLLANGQLPATDERVSVHQGLSLYRASELFPRFHLVDGRVEGCWLYGLVERQDPCWYRDYPDE